MYSAGGARLGEAANKKTCSVPRDVAGGFPRQGVCATGLKPTTIRHELGKQGLLAPPLVVSVRFLVVLFCQKYSTLFEGAAPVAPARRRAKIAQWPKCADSVPGCATPQGTKVPQGV
jgi:hypothetical protein